MLIIVLLAVSLGSVQPPAATLERASNLPLDQPLLTAADSPADSLALPEYRVRVFQPSDKPRIYIVQQGENPSIIGERYGVDMYSMLWTNELENGETIQPGRNSVFRPCRAPGAR